MLAQGVAVADRNGLNKEVRKAIRKDVFDYNTRIIQKTIEENRGPKVFRKRTNWKNENIFSLKDETGNIHTDLAEINNIMRSTNGYIPARPLASPNILTTQEPN